MNWQPIATAPRDGTHILACNATSSFGWMNGKPLPPIQTTVHYWPHGDKPGFYASVNEMEPQHPFDATHWKPLDAPAAGPAPSGHTCGMQGFDGMQDECPACEVNRRAAGGVPRTKDA